MKSGITGVGPRYISSHSGRGDGVSGVSMPFVDGWKEFVFPVWRVLFMGVINVGSLTPLWHVTVGRALFGKEGRCWSWAVWWTSKLVPSLMLCLSSEALSWYRSEAYFNRTGLWLDMWAGTGRLELCCLGGLNEWVVKWVLQQT